MLMVVAKVMTFIGLVLVLLVLGLLVLVVSVLVLLLHSGFDPSDLPIWSDFVGGNFRLRAFFLVRAIDKKKCSGSENTQTNYRSNKC